MKVLIADDHPIVRSSMKHVLTGLDEDVEVVETDSFADAANAIAENSGLDLVLLDLLMPDMSPVEGLRKVVGGADEVPVVVVSAIENRRDALQAIDAGAMGFIPKTVSHEEFLRMLRLVLDGGLCLPRSLSDTASAAPSHITTPLHLVNDDRVAGLTKRQRQVLEHLSEGKSNIEIARDLGVSDKTVRFYISAILKSLKVKNRTQAALVAVELVRGERTASQ